MPAAHSDAVLRDLMALVATGDRGAFELLYERVSPTVFGLAKRVARDPGVAADITQEVMVAVWKQAADYDPAQGAVLSWVATMTRRRAIDAVRSIEASRRRERADPPPSAAYDPVVEVIDRSEEHVEVRTALSDLTDKEWVVIRMAYYEDMTYRQIAGALDIPVNTVKTRARAGLLRLADRMGGSRV